MLDRSGTFDGTTDERGNLRIRHGEGRAPRMWGLRNLTENACCLAVNSDGETLTVRVIEATGSPEDRLPHYPAHGTWWLKF